MSQNKRPSTSRLSLQSLRNFFGKSTPQNGNSSRQKYLEDLVFQHRTFDVKGIAAPGEATLPLQDVFVDVGLGTTPQKASANPIPAMRANAREERFPIWRFLAQPNAQKPDNLVILGAPGTGKTTLLKHLVLSAAVPTQDAPRINRLPIFLYLRDIAHLIEQDPRFQLLDGIQNMFMGRGVNLSLDWLGAELANGRCLILLDGLDEVANLEQRQQVAAWVQRQITQQNQNQFIITSRPFGYESNPLPNTILLEVKPFTIEQIRRFVNNWYMATEMQMQQRNDVGVQRDATENATDLLNRLHQTPALLEMGINPLLLTMIATIHHYRSSLPDQRVALYHEICDVFLGKRQQARGISYELTPLQKKRVLQTLAFEMMRRNLRNIPRAQAADIIDPALRRVHPHSTSTEFLRMIADTSGLLIEHTPGVYSFAHLTFQEYLTAVFIKEEQQEQHLLNQVDNAWWHESIRLYAAQTNATNIIRACVMRETPSIPALTLAVECLDEALEVEDDFRKIPGELLRSIEDDNPEIRRIGAEVRLLLRVRNLVRLDEATYADRSLVTQAEYQLFLDEMRHKGRYLQPDHWQEMQFSKGAGQKPVAGVRPSDAEAFCDWLSERHPGPWRYRLPTAREIGRPPFNEPSENIADDSLVGYWFKKNGRPELLPSPVLRHDKALIETLQRKLKDKLLKDLLVFRELDENNDAFKKLQTVILTQAKQRAYSLLDLERRLPFAENGGAEIGRFFSLIQDRTTEGIATEMEQSLIEAKVYVDNPNLVFAKSPLLEEIIAMGNRLLHSLNHFSFPEKANQLMRQLMRDLGRARETIRHDKQSEFLTHRELVRHINSALSTAQILLDELNRCRTDARIRLRMGAFKHSLQLLQRHSHPPLDESTRPRLDRLRVLQILVDLYVDMAILESRDSNLMEATEGIRLIRESTLMKSD